jgi:hypothetical protein
MIKRYNEHLTKMVNEAISSGDQWDLERLLLLLKEETARVNNALFQIKQTKFNNDGGK